MHAELSKIDPKRRCVPRTQGEHPGEWHEAAHSWIDERTARVMVSIRHLETGHVSQVELSDVVFGVDADKFLEELKAGELKVDGENLPQEEAGETPNLRGYNMGDASRPKDWAGSGNKPLMRSLTANESRPLQGIAPENLMQAAASDVAVSPQGSRSEFCRGIKVSDSQRLTLRKNPSCANSQLSTFNSELVTLRPPVGRWDAAIQPGRYWRFWQGQREVVDVFPNDRGVWMVRTEFGEDMELELCAGAQFMRATEVAA